MTWKIIKRPVAGARMWLCGKNQGHLYSLIDMREHSLGGGHLEKGNVNESYSFVILQE